MRTGISRPTARRAVPPSHAGAFENLTEEARRREEIARRAYFKAEARGFAPGGEVADWLQAEAEIDAAREGTH